MKERLNLTPASAVQGGFHLSALQERYATAVIREAEVATGKRGAIVGGALSVVTPGLRTVRECLLRGGGDPSSRVLPPVVLPDARPESSDPATAVRFYKRTVTGIRLVSPGGDSGHPLAL